MKKLNILIVAALTAVSGSAMAMGLSLIHISTGRVSAAPAGKSCRDHKIHSRLKSTRRCRKRPFTTSAITASIKQQKQNIYLTLFSDKY